MKKKVLIPLIVVIALAGAGVWFVADYYHSDESVQTYMQKKGKTEIHEIKEGIFLDGPGEDEAVIFYPGAKVEYTAYIPMLYGLAEKGVDCFLVKMPCNLAVLGQNKADDILEHYEYTHWYLAGHSLGGAMAASYASNHLDDLDGLILLAAYPTKSLKSEDFSVLSVYGSEDGVLNMAKYEEVLEWMPDNYEELCIEGGCHAYFGNYGKQKGDGTAGISREEQQEQTAEAVVRMIEGMRRQGP